MEDIGEREVFSEVNTRDEYSGIGLVSGFLGELNAENRSSSYGPRQALVEDLGIAKVYQDVSGRWGL